MGEIFNFFRVWSDFIWGPVMLVLLIGTGIYLTIGLRFYTFRHLGEAVKMLFTGCKSSTPGLGEQSPFNALMTALAGTIGTGSIVGVATAIMAGGPGALFWMWCTALVGMATYFTEIVLAMTYREKTAKGSFVGGAMYSIKNGLSRKWRWLAYAFAFFTVISSFGTGNSVQTNAIAGALQGVFGLPKEVTAITIFVLVGGVLLGGVKRIGKVAGKLVPLMIVLYLVTAFAILFMNIEHFPSVIAMIVKDAFTPTAASGGFAGATVMMAIRYGMARGVFANEAGLGSGPIAHATAISTPMSQATVGMLDVCISTFIVCTVTGFAVLITGQWCSVDAQGASLTAMSFNTCLPGIGNFIVTMSLVLFAFTTILGWCVYGERCAIFVFGEKASTVFRIVFSCVAPLGALVQLDVVWVIADVSNGMMAIPNLIGILLLSPVVFKTVREAEKNSSASEKQMPHLPCNESPRA